MNKKLGLILFFMFLLCNNCFAARWFEFLEKKYIDLESISIDKYGYVVFWVKALRNGSEPIKNFWYSIDKLSLDCSNKRISTDVVMAYDLKQKLIFSDESSYHEWHSIAPDTHADAYYRLFCIFDFNENPIYKQGN